jgi:heme-degrading monooxygenase HmoA
MVMFTRITWATVAPDKIDDLVAAVQTAKQSISQHDGYRGTALLVNRTTGGAAAITYWETAGAMLASEETASQARATTQSSVNALRITEIDRLEMVIEERLVPPQPGGFLRVNDTRADPTKLDAAVAALRDVLPVLKAQPGLRAVIVGVNRETGRIIASSAWNSAAERDASDAAIAPQREKVRQSANAESVKVELYESVLLELKLATTV